MNWEQLKSILWLRWRLTKNRFGRAGPVNAVIAFFMLAFMLIGAVTSAAAGFLVCAFALRGEGPQVLLLVWDGALIGFLIVWVSGLMVEIQRAESIDLPKLLHLPVTLQQVFVFNYAASHFTPSIILFLPGMMGMCAGLVLSNGPGMILLVPLVLSLIFMLTAWTYCLRGWLAALMINKRRRQTVVVWITVGFVLITQIPNALVHSRLFSKQRHTSHQPNGAESQPKPGPKSDGLALPESILTAHLAVPLGWLGYGAMALRQNIAWPALGATAAGCLLGALGLMRAYRTTIRFYQGAEALRPVKPTRTIKAGPRKLLLVERGLPGLPEDTAALALATFRSLLRAPEMRMGMIMPVIAIVGICSVSFVRSSHSVPGYLAAFVGTAVAVFGTFPLTPLMSNIFGLDRDGFRALVLLPTRRHRVLLARNLAVFPFAGAIALVFMTVVKFLVRMPWEGFLASLLQVPVAFLLFSLLCNVIAMLAPYRFAAGTLQAKKPKPIVFLGVLALFITLPVVLTPLLIPPGLQLLFSLQGWMPWLPINVLASIIILAGVAALYALLLPWEGRLLQRREQAILRSVTEEAE